MNVLNCATPICVYVVSRGWFLRLLYFGSFFTFKIISQGKPKPVIRWSKEGTDLEKRGMIQEHEGVVQLTLRNLTKSDSGTYVLTAENPSGNIRKTVNLVVIGKFCVQLFVMTKSFRLVTLTGHYMGQNLFVGIADVESNCFLRFQHEFV